jgi:2-oxoglutarate dehydrogenase E1 component
MAKGDIPLDWSAAEALAFATLAGDGRRVRLSGQDSARGTFSHRHAVLHDVKDGRTYVPLQNVAKDQAPVEIYNSPLSEAAVLGFEYGYSIGCPDGLVLWEAQFGDFINAAQVYVDQFITSAEQKWRRLSGIVLLLPHGLEGMGPEHSSARIERFLQLAVDDNVQVVYPTTPAQYFHCLRRQALRTWRKPLVVMTPKSLLRHPRVVSPLDDFARGAFQRVIPDALPASGVAKIILCSGKIYYELEQKRAELGRNDVAIVRIEQLYPLDADRLAMLLERYPGGTPVLWVQEEPENMSAWPHLKLKFGEALLGRFPFSCVSRPESASPATGSPARHKKEQERLLAKAFSAA